jgi:hypothetical protein
MLSLGFRRSYRAGCTAASQIGRGNRGLLLLAGPFGRPALARHRRINDMTLIRLTDLAPRCASIRCAISVATRARVTCVIKALERAPRRERCLYSGARKTASVSRSLHGRIHGVPENKCTPRTEPPCGVPVLVIRYIEHQKWPEENGTQSPLSSTILSRISVASAIIVGVVRSLRNSFTIPMSLSPIAIMR